VPANGEARKSSLLDRFDLAAKAREALLTDFLENFGIAPFTVAAVGAELALEKLAWPWSARSSGSTSATSRP
jgi:hypothetical protein